MGRGRVWGALFFIALATSAWRGVGATSTGSAAGNVDTVGHRRRAAG